MVLQLGGVDSFPEDFLQLLERLAMAFIPTGKEVFIAGSRVGGWWKRIQILILLFLLIGMIGGIPTPP